MQKHENRRIASLIVMCAITLAIALRSTQVQGIRTVDFLLIFAGGMCAGVALSLLMQKWRTKTNAER